VTEARLELYWLPLVSWLLVAAALDLAAVRLPDHGRAPGWDTGVALAVRRTDSGRPSVQDRT